MSARARAVVYTRVSTRGQEDRYSLPQQREMCEQRCAEQGYDVREVLVDVYTGDELKERPEMARLLAMLDRRELDVIVALDLDRLSRDPRQYFAIDQYAREGGARIELLSNDYSTADPMGFMQLSMLATFAQIERLKIRERSKLGKRQRARQGKIIPSHRPLYGYIWDGPDKARYIEHAPTAAIVRRIFESVAGGGTMRSLCAALTAEGVPSPTDWWLLEQGKPPRGRPWRPQTIADMIHNPAYVGDVRAFRWDETQKRRDVDAITGEASVHRLRLVRPDDQTVAIPDGAPALVSRELAQAAQARLTANKAEAARNAKAITALLRAGYIRCGSCGRVMYVRQSVTRRESPRYFCPSHRVDERRRAEACPTPKVLIDQIDRRVWDIVRARVSDPRWIAAEFSKRQDNRGDQEERVLASLDKQVAEIGEERHGLVRGVAMTREGDGVRAALIAELYQLDERERSLAGQREHILGVMRDRDAMRAKVEQFTAWCEKAAPILAPATYEQKRLFLYVLSVQVTVTGGTIKAPEWTYEDVMGQVESGAIVSGSRMSACCPAPGPSTA